MLRPFHSVALLFHDDANDQPKFLGSCFSFRTPTSFLTARHCIGKLTAEDLRLLLPLPSQWPSLVRVRSVVPHDEADLAVLHVQELPVDTVSPFDGISALLDWGEPVMALGYPEESEVDGPVPSARLFSGSVQRLVTRDSTLGYRYKSGEVSFGSPAGLSGAPVFPSRELTHVVGVMAENHDSTTYLRSVEEVQENGEVYRQHQHEVIRFGIFVDLTALRSWLDEVAPAATT